MALAAAILLLALVVPALLINLYFTALLLGRWPRLRSRLGRLFQGCGADTSACSAVVQTPYARLLGGAPNVWLGLAWCAALASLAGRWIADGAVSVPWPFLAVAAATVALGVYLTWVLVRVLRQPCPL